MVKSLDIDENIKTLMGLVRYYSPTKSESAISEWLVWRMASLGYTHSFQDSTGNAIGIVGNGTHQFVFLGHIDTVPGEIPIELSNNTLYGRGTVDAKGSLAAFVDAVAQIGNTPNWQFIVIGAVDEEGDSTGARAVVSSYKPDYCIVGEPSHWDRLALGYKGSAWAQISTKKPITHTARMEEGVCERLLANWITIQDWVNSYNLDYERNFDKIQIGLRGWNSGEDEFEEWATMNISTRLPPNFQPNQWYDILNKTTVGARVDQLGYPIPAYVSNKNNRLVKAFLRSIRNNGGIPSFVFKTGTSDANVVAQSWNCPIVIYGPGDSNLDHTAQEHIQLEDFLLSVEVVKDVIHHIVQNE
jgi:[amino group carrier protein]-lysine/ornithine hydrolase